MPNATHSQKENWRYRASKSLWTFLTIAAAILFYYLLQHLGSISSFFSGVIGAVSPIIWGLVIAYLLDPLAKLYERQADKMFSEKTRLHEKYPKRRRAVSSLLAMFTALLCIALLGVMIVPEISDSISGIVKELPSQVDSIMRQLESRTLFDDETPYGKYANDALLSAMGSLEEWLLSDLASQLNLLFGVFYNGVLGFFMSFFTFFKNLLIGFILSAYVLIDKDRLQRQVKQMTYSILPTRTAGRFRHMLGRANKKFYAQIIGKSIDSIIIGVLCYVLILLMNLAPIWEFPYPVLLAVIVGVTNVVPFFGPFVGAFITGLIVLFNSPAQTIWYLLLILVLQQFDCNYLDPHIVGGSIGLRPFWSIFACLLGSGLFGVIGFVIGPSMFAFVYELISEWSDARLRSKHLEELFDIPPEEEFEDFAELDEDFTSPLLHEESDEEEPEKEHRITVSREKLRKLIHKNEE